MSETERIGIKLNRMTVIAINEYKRLKYRDSNIPLADSFVISDALRSISAELGTINWQDINEDNPYLSSLHDLTYSDIESLRTTLVFDNSDINELREFQARMMSDSEGRVFLSYVVKIVMFASILKLQGNLSEFTN